MIYLINDVRQHERHFWNCLYGVATQEQIKRILDGHKVIISDTISEPPTTKVVGFSVNNSIELSITELSP